MRGDVEKVADERERLVRLMSAHNGRLAVRLFALCECDMCGRAQRRLDELAGRRRAPR